MLDSVGAGALRGCRPITAMGAATRSATSRASVALARSDAARLGLDRLVDIGGPSAARRPRGAYGRMAEASPGKDSVTGHWEMMGIVLDRAFPVFPNGFPPNSSRRSSSGSVAARLATTPHPAPQIIDDLGAEHVRTGKPIVYTSADSVFQIAAHEDVIPIEEQYRINHIAFELAVGGTASGA